MAGLVVALAALVQGAVGYGMALVAVPLLALVDTALVPVPLLVLTAGHSLLAVFREGRHADWPGVGWAMLGRLPGTGLGVLAVVAMSQRMFSLLIGICVLVFVLLSLLTWRPLPRPRSLMVAGVASGAGGTAAGIGGPPIALLYQNATGPRVRGTLAAYFALGSVTSIAALPVRSPVSRWSARPSWHRSCWPVSCCPARLGGCSTRAGRARRYSPWPLPAPACSSATRCCSPG